jgi:hypothetical protein
MTAQTGPLDTRQYHPSGDRFQGKPDALQKAPKPAIL